MRVVELAVRLGVAEWSLRSGLRYGSGSRSGVACGAVRVPVAARLAARFGFPLRRGFQNVVFSHRFSLLFCREYNKVDNAFIQF